jgi:MOSC domain-containing protein YiiM
MSRNASKAAAGHGAGPRLSRSWRSAYRTEAVRLLLTRVRRSNPRRTRIARATIFGVWEGIVVSIHIAPEASAPMQSITEVRAVPGRGLEGDRYFAGTGYYSNKPSHGGREVTLIEIEALEALSGDLLNRSGEQVGITLSAPDSRRNIATSGVPLNHLVDREFRVGSVLMRGTRLCEPCKHLEDLTHRGLMSGLIHRGGLRAQIVSGGVIRVGDAVRPRQPEV